MIKFNPGTEDLCSRCPHHLGQQSFNDCFLDNPPYRLALDVEDVKDVRTDVDMSYRPSVGWAKDCFGIVSSSLSGRNSMQATHSDKQFPDEERRSARKIHKWLIH
ncbi:hypothetical protein BJ166DRAFT_622720 [Pestalotiopsis sp. NC0098]|nr:hypothetical protein BJ166DRAFT_622720 [Pestalotiopsis sp. NC0098]